MKLLTEYYELSEAEEMAKALESKGIVTHIASKWQREYYLRGGIQVSLWAVLDHQYNDAILYINNPKHEITSSISPEELAELKSHTKIYSYSTWNKFLLYAIPSIIFILITVFILAKMK